MYPHQKHFQFNKNKPTLIKANYHNPLKHSTHPLCYSAWSGLGVVVILNRVPLIFGFNFLAFSCLSVACFGLVLWFGLLICFSSLLMWQGFGGFVSC